MGKFKDNTHLFCLWWNRRPCLFFTFVVPYWWVSPTLQALILFFNITAGPLTGLKDEYFEISVSYFLIIDT
jgi:hypothetical protein